MTPELKAKLEACKTLPSPPGVAAQIIALANDPEAEIGRISKVMALDPAITAKVLRLANSPLYARRAKVASLHQAVVVLGLNATISLALSFSLLKSWQNDKAQDGLDYPLFWRRALLSATAGRALAQELRLRNAEEVFLTCLLQDIGMLALTRVVNDLYAPLADEQAAHDKVVSLEQEKLGVDHAAVGGWLLKSWHFPDGIEQGVAGSHDPSRTPRVHPNATFVRCVHVAGLIAEHFLAADGRRLSALTAAAQTHLEIGKDRLNRVLDAIKAAIPDVEQVFETKMMDETQADAILENAREALMMRSLQSLHAIEQLKGQTDSLDERTRELEESSRRDSLTGLFNRRYLDEYLAAAFVDARTSGRALSVAFADLDGFKNVNDTHGHRAGDEVLVATARLLQCNVRSSDVVARYGGEEFVVVFPGTDRLTVRAICERIVRACAEARHELEAAGALTVTISIGTATFDPASGLATVAELVAAADKALYAAKLGGRNRAVSFDLVA